MKGLTLLYFYNLHNIPSSISLSALYAAHPKNKQVLLQAIKAQRASGHIGRTYIGHTDGRKSNL